ncbi:MAG: tyrosine-type recombinase/integrase [Anaerolineales bacterium]
MDTKENQPLAIQGLKLCSIALRDAWTDFFLSREIICTPSTLKNYTNVLGKFIDWLETNGIEKPEQINSRLIRAYLSQFIGKSEWYCNDIGRQIRTFIHFLYKEKYITELPVFEIPKVHQKRLPFLTAEQIEAVLSIANIIEKAIVTFMVDCGARKQEVINLNRSDVDMKNGIVTIRQGKGRKDRITVIGATTRRALLQYLRTVKDQSNDAPLFQTFDGRRFTGDGLNSVFRRLSKKTGITITPHMLRRSFATLALKNKIDIVSLQALMGHSDITTTRNYIQWLDADLLVAHRQASPIDGIARKKI